jgi:hypothetical protein
MTNAVYLASLVNSTGYNVTLSGASVSSGTGVAFPATQSASSDANTLDDYEEGTFTPTISPGGGSITTVTTGGWYIKVGRSVTIFAYWNVSNAGTASGGWNVGGLPFTILNTGTYGGGSRGFLSIVREDAITGVVYQAFWNNNTTAAAIQRYDGPSPTWTSGYVMITSGTYITT